MSREIYGDQDQLERPQRGGSPWGDPITNQMRFYQTVAGPGGTAYPTEASNPNSYYVRWLKQINFTEVPGTQTLNSATTTKYDYIHNMAKDSYIPIGTKGMAWKFGARWYTLR